MRRRILKLLARSFEAPLKVGDRRRLERALAASPDLRARREAMEALRRKVADTTLPGFAPGFADRVLDRLAARRKPGRDQDVFPAVFHTLFQRFVVVAVLLLIILISYNLSDGGLLPKNEVFFISDMTFGRLLELPLF